MGDKMHIRVILKSGIDFVIKCEKFTIENDYAGKPKRYSLSGVEENEPIYLNLDEVAAIVRLRSNEKFE